MQQVTKAPKKYEIKQDSLTVPYSVHRRLKIPRSFMGVAQPEAKHDPGAPRIQTQTSSQEPTPYQMSRSFIKYMLFYRIVGYLASLSLVLSFLSIYWRPGEDMLILINNGMTVAMLIGFVLMLVLYTKYLQAKKQQLNYLEIILVIVQGLLLVPHPTIWTHNSNHYLHLAMTLRLALVLKFYIYSSIYCDVRAYRIIKINGLNSKEHFLFAVKSLVDSLDLPKILGLYLASVLFFTHCLYLVSLDDGIFYDLLDCFEVVIVTIPTVGFGEYSMPLIGQKIILGITVISGAVLNSFVTLSMLSQLQMSQSELSSYWLMKKIEAREHIELISKDYIQKSFTIIRKKVHDQSSAQDCKEQINFSFRNEYKLKKSLYNSISYTDLNNLFAYFRDRLVEMKITELQTNNMVSVLVRALYRHHTKKNHKRKAQEQH